MSALPSQWCVVCEREELVACDLRGWRGWYPAGYESGWEAGSLQAERGEELVAYKLRGGRSW